MTLEKNVGRIASVLWIVVEYFALKHEVFKRVIGHSLF